MNGLLLLLALTDSSAVLLGDELGHEDFRRREMASRSLRLAAPLVPHQLERLSLSDDLETSRRARKILADMRQQWMEHYQRTLRPAGWKRLPWIDSDNRIMSGQEYLRIALETITLEERQREEYRAWRLATYYWLMDRLRDGTPLVEIQSILEQLARAEEEWLTRNPAFRVCDE